MIEGSSWKRFALVTDAEWVAKAMHMFTWLLPGEVLIRDLDGLEEAKRGSRLTPRGLFELRLQPHTAVTQTRRFSVDVGHANEANLIADERTEPR